MVHDCLAAGIGYDWQGRRLAALLVEGDGFLKFGQLRFLEWPKPAKSLLLNRVVASECGHFIKGAADGGGGGVILRQMPPFAREDKAAFTGFGVGESREHAPKGFAHLVGVGNPLSRCQALAEAVEGGQPPQ